MAGKNFWRGNEAKKIVVEAAREALWTAGEDLIEKVQNEVPVLSGTLRRSATVTEGQLPDMEQVYEQAKAGRTMKDAFRGAILGTLKQLSVYVSYNTPYARRQHEEDYRHPLGGRRKYLESTFNLRRQAMLNYVNAQIDRALRWTR